MNNKFNIRLVTQKDFTAVLELSCKLEDYVVRFDPLYLTGQNFRRIAESYLRKDFKSHNSQIWLVQHGARSIGFCLVRIQKPYAVYAPEKIGYIVDMYIEPKFRRFGLGAKMLKKVVESLRKKNIRHIELFVDVRNTIGFNAWRKYGFRPTLIRMRKNLK